MPVFLLMPPLGCDPLKLGANPATWMLEVTGGAISIMAKAVNVRDHRVGGRNGGRKEGRVGGRRVYVWMYG